MRTASAPSLFAIGLLIVAAVGGITFGVGTLAGVGDVGLPDVETPTTPTSDPTLNADQVEVSGVAAGIAIAGARITEIAVPGVVTPSAGLGSGARFENVLVDGQPATIAWDAGRPLVFAAETPLVMRPSPFDLAATPAGMVLTYIDDTVHLITPGEYEIDTDVAVSFGGLAEPRSSVTFTATEDSTVAFTGGANSTVPPAALQITGPGRVVLEGRFDVRRPDGTTASATNVTMEDGSFRVSFAPLPDGTGFDITDGLLEGAVTITPAPATED